MRVHQPSAVGPASPPASREPDGCEGRCSLPASDRYTRPVAGTVTTKRTRSHEPDGAPSRYLTTRPSCSSSTASWLSPARRRGLHQHRRRPGPPYPLPRPSLDPARAALDTVLAHVRVDPLSVLSSACARPPRGRGSTTPATRSEASSMVVRAARAAADSCAVYALSEVLHCQVADDRDQGAGAGAGAVASVGVA